MNTPSSDPDIDEIAARLRAAGCVFAEEEAAILIDDTATPAELEARIARRVEGEPLEYIVGWAEFCGLRVSVAPGVFVPRQRTGLLVREALRVAPTNPTVLDLCCGAGAIGAAILAARQDAMVYAADIDAAATECARRTLAAVASSSSARVYTGDLYDPLPAELKGGVDLLVVNAPYVPTDEIAFMPSEARDHEERAALDGGADGLALHRRVARGAGEWLSPAGYLLIETSRAQASATAGILESAGLSVSIVRDEDIDGTVAVALAPGGGVGRTPDRGAR